MTEETTQQPQQPETSKEQKDYTPPTLHAVQMRKDRHGLEYPVTLGSARPDKKGHGQLMRMQAQSINVFHNIMTPQELKECRAKHRTEVKDREQGRGRE